MVVFILESEAEGPRTSQPAAVRPSGKNITAKVSDKILHHDCM